MHVSCEVIQTKDPGFRRYFEPYLLAKPIWVYFTVFLFSLVAALLSGCTAIPLKRLQPIVAPPDTGCDSASQYRFLADEPKGFHYVYSPVNGRSEDAHIPVSFGYITEPKDANGALFEVYRSAIQDSVHANMPDGLRQDRVTIALTEFLTSVSGEAQLDAQVADGSLRDKVQIAIERTAIRKLSVPVRLTHSEMKAFADKLFDLELKPGAAALVNAPPNLSTVRDMDQRLVSARSTADNVFIAYFEAFYKGKFVDRMGTLLDKPKISTTVPDSEIVAAETVLLEFLIDTIDSTPVMGSDPVGSVTNSTIFYPGNSTNVPIAFTTNPDRYVQIPPGSKTACGITRGNVWVLRDLANGASDQAAAVGGLVENTAGGISVGLGVVGKISIGDNQTLSVMAKTAGSRVALRATLAASYWALRHVKFNVDEPD